MNTAATPDHPAGPFKPTAEFSDERCAALIDSLKQAPRRMAAAVERLSDDQLDTRYRNWTVRQIVHHLADSHVHSYIRFKWSLTEDTPTIKPYEEGDWVRLKDCTTGRVEPALALLTGLHGKWMQVLETMTPSEFERMFFHPETSENVSLWTALNYYEWHARHHTGQIVWLREHHGW